MKRMIYLMIIVNLILPQYADAQTANYNFDFEDWYTDSNGQQRLNQWQFINWSGDTVDQFHGVQQSMQSQSGNYAVTVHRWYMIDKTGLKLKNTISQKPIYLNGFYKYTDAFLSAHPDSSTVDDVATVTVYFTKWNTILNRLDTIGYGYKELPAATGYIPFSCAITYPTIDQPDSFYIYIQPTKYHSGLGCKDSSECSFLTIDNLSFSNTTAIIDADLNNKISIYPNPAKEELVIHTDPAIVVQKYSLADIMGRIVFTQVGDIKKINLNHLSPGNYSLMLETNKGSLAKKIVVK